ncbi:hypothetical protein UCDDS831_g08189 [Diplodia seriata]|uniref:Uncharacterized protein n=1 Tax=Diplodia seriata TaxID=420778 RepID=A0A0G2DV51_9PEZI|nr:hypothetical protein UCDDS831_g08189 [Diplodia seriata]
MAQNGTFPPHQKKNKKGKGKGKGKGKKGQKPSTNTTTNTNAAAQNNENARPSTSTTTSSPSPAPTFPTAPLPPPPRRGTPLTRDTAIPGRIVWMPAFAADSTALKYGARPSAAEHPGVITDVDPLPSVPDGSPAPKPTVKVLPITSWGGVKTAAEKWSVGEGGVALRAYYRLIANDRPAPAVGGEGEAVMEEAGIKVLRLRDGKRMRSRSYISLRDDKIIIEIEGLDLFSNGGDEDIFLEERFLEELTADHRAVTLKKLSTCYVP